MNIMPMDYYPMPANENSQIKNLEEEKSRLNQKRQAVNEISLTNSQKDNINDSIDSKTDNIKNLIRHEDRKKAQKEKSDKSYLQEMRKNNLAIEKQALETDAKCRMFDKIV